MTYEQFRVKYEGKPVDFDGYYGNQCMDLYRQYCKEVLEVPQSPSVNGAKDVWNTYLKDIFDRIDNTPTGVPQKGDIIIWGVGVGPYGHIAIFDNGDSNSFTSFDQNWPVNSLCHLQPHNYNGVLGWLRKKGINVPPAPEPCVITDSTKIPQIENREVQEIKSSLFAKDIALRDKENRILNLESTVTALNSTIEGLQYRLDHLPPNSSQALFIQLRDVIWGKGFWWTKWAKIKELLPR